MGMRYEFHLVLCALSQIVGTLPHALRFRQINNGVYRAGFSTSQGAYEKVRQGCWGNDTNNNGRRLVGWPVIAP